MEELGRNLTQAPMLGSVVLAAQAVLASGAEPGYNARAVGRRWELRGDAHYVLDGAAADLLLAAATPPDGLGLLEVDPRQRALELTVAHLLTRVQFGQPLGVSRPSGTEPPTCTSSRPPSSTRQLRRRNRPVTRQG